MTKQSLHTPGPEAINKFLQRLQKELDEMEHFEAQDSSFANYAVLIKQSIRFIADITEERNKLKEDNECLTSVRDKDMEIIGEKWARADKAEKQRDELWEAAKLGLFVLQQYANKISGDHPDKCVHALDALKCAIAKGDAL